MESKRKFERFDLPLVVAFRQTNSASEYSMGLIRNFSCGGLSLVSYDTPLTPLEKLELNLRFPHSNKFVPFSGSVIWKKEGRNKCVAGVKLEMTDEEIQNRVMENMFSYGNIPVKKLLYSKGPGHIADKATGVKQKPEKTGQGKTSPEKSERSGSAKEYLEDGSMCKVTFRLPEKAAPDAQNVAVAGDFNEWDITKTPMTRHENGDFSVTLDLQCGKEYKFKYLINGSRWENDWSADKYVTNPYGAYDSVIIV